MSAPLLIHIGYHKTATTWMQRQLFQPMHGYRQLCGHQEVFDHIVKPHGLRFDPAPMQALIVRGIEGLLPDEAPVISSEILSGHPFQGGRESDVYAERLHRIAPEARILISIRSQLRILPSVYMQYVLRGGTMPPSVFFKGTHELGYFGFTPEHFKYDLLLAHYQKLFGAENVYVLPQESLKRDRDAVLGQLAAFSGNSRYPGLVPEAMKPVGESYPEHASPILRRINHLQKSTLNPWPLVSLGTTPEGLYKIAGYLLKKPPLAGFLRKHKPATAYVNRHFAGHFARCNARLAELVTHAIDLSDYEGVGQLKQAPMVGRSTGP